ncbi:ABC transporter permease [Galactobacter caseinivorans]|uniref:ABC transporter permease n=1 Tax=Galactobacter caseinivorans TaxID=2676123 RepID=UPI001F305371|nr:ABC transporter permease [Galactobacter caseinivorans]
MNFFPDFLTQLPGATELGLIYAVSALGVYLTFRILDFPDLTVDGSFTTGAAAGAVMVSQGVPPWISLVVAFAAGAVAGSVTGLLHTKGKINGLLASIIVMIALYSINLHIMDNKANLPLLLVDTVFTPLEAQGLLRNSWMGSLILGLWVLLLCAVLVAFLHTRAGLSLRSTGDNEQMAGSFRVSTDGQKIIGLSLSNGMVAVSGALMAQYNGAADVTSGIGLIVIGLASVIVGQALFGQRHVWQAVVAAAAGAVIYRWVLQLAMAVGLPPQDLKLASAVLVVAALLLPRLSFIKQLRNNRAQRRREEALAGTIDVPTEQPAVAVAHGAEAKESDRA